MATGKLGRGQVRATRDAMGTITRNVYNGAGQLTDTYANCTTSGTTIPSDWANCTGAGTADGTFNLHTAFAYDDRGNQVSVTAPNGRTTTSVYDAADRLSLTIDNDVASPAGPTEDVTTEYFYDDLGRQAAVRTANPEGTGTTVTRTLYNADGTVAQVIAGCTDTGTTPPADPATCAGTGTADAASVEFADLPMPCIVIDHGLAEIGSPLAIAACEDQALWSAILASLRPTAPAASGER